MHGISISVSYVGTHLDIVLLAISGYIDTTTCQELAKTFKDLIQQKRYFFIADISDVTYISSAGWGVFVGEIKNIRDKGGDLKVVQMSQELFEVFEMLEFHRILNYYDTIEEAINEFDIIRGIDITKVDPQVEKMLARQNKQLSFPKGSVTVQTRKSATGPQAKSSKLTQKDFPLNEKIKMIVVENPFWGIKSICKQLRAPKYGSMRIGWLRMHSILRSLNLETKEKRYRFYRSR
jgi:anti-sigma B factor antagonist